ncbi:MAG TPA: hypothetical protein P5267_01460 [Patescibacteria group bacterium]|nr:hypothetical protein [Patescibacteria group bacterium]
MRTTYGASECGHTDTKVFNEDGEALKQLIASLIADGYNLDPISGFYTKYYPNGLCETCLYVKTGELA